LFIIFIENNRKMVILYLIILFNFYMKNPKQSAFK